MTLLDAIDRKILGHLQTDGRMTMQELADKVGPVGLALPSPGESSWRSAA
jgi:DNA-binding Lrp family transcriptional regulator